MSIYPQWSTAAPGWLCPRCNTVNAPTTLYCYFCAPRQTVTADKTGTNPTALQPTTGVTTT